MGDKDRAEFKSWAVSYFDLDLFDGEYTNSYTKSAYASWQASAARYQSRIAELEAEVVRLKSEREWQPIETAPTDGTEIPCGYALVPIEPTDAMLKAAIAHDEKMYAHGSDHGATIEDCWYLMVAEAMKGGE